VSAPVASLETTLLGVRLASPLITAPRLAPSVRDLEALIAARPGAVCLRPVTVQPFVHPEFRALHNPGHDRLLPIVRQLREMKAVPIVACVAGSTAEELGFLARVFGEAGAALVQLHLGDPWVEATLAPFEDRAALARLCAEVRANATTPVLAEVPVREARSYATIAQVLANEGIGGVVIENDFDGLEKFALEAGRDTLELVAVGNAHFGWDVARTLHKGARAVELDEVVRLDGPRAIRRITDELQSLR
jgi:dihydroorotate dehydrogenase